MPAISFKDTAPVIHETAFIAPNAWITGDVEIGEEASVFFSAVLRGDIEKISVGKGSNIQDHSMVHTSTGRPPAVIGNYVTIGHRVTVHGATVKDHCIVGMGSTLLDGATVEENCIIGAHSLLTENKVIPAGTLAFGNPCKVIRDLTDEELKYLKYSADSYIRVSQEYKKNL